MSPEQTILPRSEKEKMLAGEIYFADDPELLRERIRARRLTRLFNDSRENELPQRSSLLDQLLGSHGGGLSIEPPLYCDYGYNIHVGERFYANFGCVILDVCEVRIGDDCLLAPGVHIYTASHPVDPKLRAAKQEFGRPVAIGNNVWIGGNAIILPGVVIGNNVVVAAGSVVTKNIPDNALVAGNPAVIRKDISREDVR